MLKAFLLVAGLGKRLRPVTDDIPKCLLPINGKPLLQIWLEHLSNHGIDEVLINTHRLHERIEQFIATDYPSGIRKEKAIHGAGADSTEAKNLKTGKRKKIQWPEIRLFYEPELLGSAGTLLSNRDWVDDGNPFFILYGDNLTNVNLREMLAFHHAHSLPFTLGVFRTKTPKECGIAEVGEDGLVTGFAEKPKDPKSNLAAAGVYVADQRIFDFFPGLEFSQRPFDLGFHVFPRLAGRMKAYHIEEFLMDIGTIGSYEKAQTQWRKRHSVHIIQKDEKGHPYNHFSYDYIEELKRDLDNFPHDHFERFIDAMMDAYREGQRIFVMGNGGSASTASHWVCDINKGCCLGKEKKFKMICLNDSISTMLAYANDHSYEDIFVQQLKNFFVPGDVVIGISGSGNSQNVLRAIEYANVNKGTTVGLCGFSGGRLYTMVDIPILVNAHDMQKVEDVHMIVAHMAMQRILEELGGWGI